MKTFDDYPVDIRLAVLHRESEALLDRADWHERMTAITHDDIATAHAAGMTLDGWYAEQQGDR